MESHQGKKPKPSTRPVAKVQVGRSSLLGVFERWDHLPSTGKLFRCIRARSPSIRNMNRSTAQDLSSSHPLTFMTPSLFLLCRGQLPSAARNGRNSEDL